MGDGKVLEEHVGQEILLWTFLKNTVCPGGKSVSLERILEQKSSGGRRQSPSEDKKSLACSQEKETNMRSKRSKTKVLILALEEFVILTAIVPPFCLVLYNQQSSTSVISSFVSSSHTVRDILLALLCRWRN